jgi:putative membrane protein
MAVMVLFWVGVVDLTVWAVGAMSQRRAAPTDSALEILRRRYARGEIDRAAFDEARKTLG